MHPVLEKQVRWIQRTHSHLETWYSVVLKLVDKPLDSFFHSILRSQGKSLWQTSYNKQILQCTESSCHTFLQTTQLSMPKLTHIKSFIHIPSLDCAIFYVTRIYIYANVRLLGHPSLFCNAQEVDSQQVILTTVTETTSYCTLKHWSLAYS